MQSQTHHKIKPALCGEITALSEGKATVTLTTTAQMVADERGLVHGGFVFGMADYAAMVAVNDPNVVLGAAECRFLAPVAEGQSLVASAILQEVKGKKHAVTTTVECEGTAVFAASFTCFVLEGHVFDQ